MEQRDRVDRIVAWAALGIALSLRLVAAYRLSPHTDEPSTQLAMARILETGVPMFRSGVLYLQGATVSYLLALVGLLGFPGVDDLAVQRLVTVVPSAFGVVLLHRLVRETTGSSLAAAIAALLLAIDPLAVQWGANVRPYGVLEVICIGAAILFHRLLVAPARRWSVGLGLAFAAITFTHVGGLMLWPGMAAVVALLYGRRAWHEGREAVIGLALALVGPGIFAAVNTWFGVTSTKATDRPAFVGNHLISLNHVLEPKFEGWFRLYGSDPWSPVLPALALLAAVVVGREVLVRRRAGLGVDVGRLVLLALMLAPFTAIATMVTDQQARYYLPAQPFALALVGCAAAWAASLQRQGAALVYAAAAIPAVVGLSLRLVHPVVDEDYRPTLAWLKGHLVEGDVVLAILPPIVELMLPGWKDRIFVAGAEWRSNRYARPTDTGFVDYWGGWPVLLDEHELCLGLLDHPGAWLVIDEERLKKGRSLTSMGKKVIPEATAVAFEQEGAARVLKVLPPERWAVGARTRCANAIAPVGPATPALAPTVGGLRALVTR